MDLQIKYDMNVLPDDEITDFDIEHNLGIQARLDEYV